MIIALVSLNAFFAASEIAIVSVRKTRIRQLADEGNASARSVLRLTDNPNRLFATIQVAVTLAGFFASAVGAVSAVVLVADFLSRSPVPVIVEQRHALALVIVTTVVAVVTLIFGELVPKNLALQHSESISLFVARPLEWTARAARPIVAFLTFSTDVVLRLLGSPEKAKVPTVSEEEIRSLVSMGEAEGVIERHEGDIIREVFELGETTAGEIMTPRTDLVAVDINSSTEEVVARFIESGHSHLPVYDGKLDNMIGILTAKDLLPFTAGTPLADSIRALVHPPTFVPESKSVGELLPMLQREPIHTVFIIDEYGGIAGLVTLEDALEELVGEIHGGTDIQRQDIQIVGPNEILASGRTSLDDVNETLGTELEHEEVDSIGGLVVSTLGRMAVAGDEIQVDSTTITVVSVTGRRIKQVRAVKHPIEPEETSPSGQERERTNDNHADSRAKRAP